MKLNSVIPELSVSDIGRSLDFYRKILGFTVEYERPADKFAFLSLGRAQIMVEQINGHWQTGKLEAPFGRGINFQIEAENLEALLKRLRGYALFREPHNVRYAVGGRSVELRQFLVLDPDGYLLRFCQPMKLKSKIDKTKTKNIKKTVK